MSRVTIRITLLPLFTAALPEGRLIMALLSLAREHWCGLLYVAIGFLINRKHAGSSRLLKC